MYQPNVSGHQFDPSEIEAARQTVIANYDESTADAVKAEAERDVARSETTLRRLKLFPRSARNRLHALQQMPLMMLAIVIEKLRELSDVDDTERQEQFKALEEVLIARWRDKDPVTDVNSMKLALDRFFIWFRTMAHQPLMNADIQIVNDGVDEDALATVVARLLIDLTESPKTDEDPLEPTC